MPATSQTSSTAEQTPTMPPPPGFPNKKSPKLRSSCDACQLGKIRCSQHKPRCQRCTNQDIVCVYSLSRRMGRPRRPMTSPIGGQEDSGAAGPQTPIAITALGGSSTNSAEDQPQQNSNLSNTLKPRPSVTMDEAEPLSRYDSHASNLNRTRHAHVQMMSTLLPGFNPTSVAVSNTDQNDLLSSPSHMFEPATTTTTSPEDFFFMEPPSPGFEHHNIIEYLDNSKFTNQIEPEPEGEIGTGSSQHQSSIKDTTNTGSLDSLNLIASMYNDPDPTEKASIFEARRHRNSMSLEIPAVGEEGMIGNSWQSFTNGLFLSPTQSQVPSATVMTTSGTSGSSNFDLGESKSSSTGHRKCGCHSNLLQKLSALDEYGTEYSIPTIDHILSFEEDTRLLISQILRCSICLSQRNGLLLLLSIIIDKIVSMLERATNGKAKARRESSLAKLNSPRATSRVKKFAQYGEVGTSPTHPCPLLVGIYKVSDEETNRFLKRFLQARLCGMSVVLNQMHQSLQQSQQGGVTRAGSLITMDLQRRLQSVTGRVELWD